MKTRGMSNAEKPPEAKLSDGSVVTLVKHATKKKWVLPADQES